MLLHRVCPNRAPRSVPHRAAVPHRAIVPFAAALAAAVILSAGCVSTGKYQSLEEERNAIAERNAALQRDTESLRQQGEALARDRSALEAEKQALEKRLAELEAREKALGSRLQQTEEEARQIKATYDGLLGSLKKELEAGQIRVQQLRDGLSVELAQEILFASGSAALDKGGSEVLQRVAEQLKQSNYQIVVTGHTDDRPIGPGLVARYPTNWELAGARAASVVRLFQESGLPPARLLAASLADTRPVAPNDTAEGRARNRRIEIRLRPVEVDA
jgi:chemotaxis protein MotB